MGTLSAVSLFSKARCNTTTTPRIAHQLGAPSRIATAHPALFLRQTQNGDPRPCSSVPTKQNVPHTREARRTHISLFPFFLPFRASHPLLIRKEEVAIVSEQHAQIRHAVSCLVGGWGALGWGGAVGGRSKNGAGEQKKRSEDLFPKISRFLWKFLVPIKYRNCDFSSVS